MAGVLWWSRGKSMPGADAHPAEAHLTGGVEATDAADRTFNTLSECTDSFLWRSAQELKGPEGEDAT